MALPSPIPDNPTRWEGWRNYNSSDLYQRLCLSFDDNPSAEQIEDNCRQILVWWQKKLPLKNQPSNPLAQMLRAGLDEAPGYVAEARTKLLDPEVRAAHDAELRVKVVEGAIGEFKKILPFAIVNGQVTPDAEVRLYEAGAQFGLLTEEVEKVIASEMERLGAVRAEIAPPPPPPSVEERSAPVAENAAPAARDPFEEFRRVLRLSRLCLEGDDMTDDQRDALCNMGESLGLTGGQAEDLIDEYLDEVGNMPISAAPPAPRPAATATMRAPAPALRPVIPSPARPASTPQPAKKEPMIPRPQVINTSPVARVQERAKYPNFVNVVRGEMLLVPSGVFFMGSSAREAAPQEQPVTQTSLSCFYLSRFPITNAQYEQFDPAHRTRRAPWADDKHPVIYVSSQEAVAFCQWLSTRDGRKYRLPTEAEWEYAARGSDGRDFPWGGRLDAGHFANFADSRTGFGWRDPNIDDGWAETSPVGAYPKGASPFGIEELAGNVFEWCLDFFDAYKGKARVNPRGPNVGTKRICRGGSWKSRAASLRASARAFNSPDYSSNDLGFRVLCECD